MREVIQESFKFTRGQTWDARLVVGEHGFQNLGVHSRALVSVASLPSPNLPFPSSWTSALTAPGSPTKTRASLAAREAGTGTCSLIGITGQCGGLSILGRGYKGCEQSGLEMALCSYIPAHPAQARGPLEHRYCWPVCEDTDRTVAEHCPAKLSLELQNWRS